MKILCVGSLNIDHVYSVDHIVSKGETIQSIQYNKYPGGKGLNQAVALSKVSNNVYMYGYIGENSDILINQLNNSIINTKYIIKTNHDTGHALIQVDKSGDNSIVVFPGANHQFDYEVTKKVISEFNEGDYLILQNEINGIDQVIDLGKKQKMKIVLNPSPYSSIITKDLLQNINYLILNQKEAIKILGSSNPKEIINSELVSKTNINIILTLGENGAYNINKDSIIFQEAFVVNVIDTTCAGDTFLGFFIGTMINTSNLKESLYTASKAASICIQHKGACISIPEIKDLK